MAKMIFLGIKKKQDSKCVFNGNFAFKFKKKDETQNIVLNERFSLDIRATCKKTRPFWPTFFFKEVCEPSINKINPKTDDYLFVEPTPDRQYLFDVKKTNQRKENDCILLDFKWNMWHYVKSPAGELTNRPMRLEGNFKIPFGEANGTLTTIPNQSGSFTIKVCCQESKEGCAVSCEVD